MNDVYVKSIYRLLAMVNDKTICDEKGFTTEATTLSNFLEQGRFYYTAAYLRNMIKKTEERGFDIDAIQASLLRILHDQNEMKLRRELQARGWKLF